MHHLPCCGQRQPVIAQVGWRLAATCCHGLLMLFAAVVLHPSHPCCWRGWFCMLPTTSKQMAEWNAGHALLVCLSTSCLCPRARTLHSQRIRWRAAAAGPVEWNAAALSLAVSRCCEPCPLLRGGVGGSAGLCWLAGPQGPPCAQRPPLQASPRTICRPCQAPVAPTDGQAMRRWAHRAH